MRRVLSLLLVIVASVAPVGPVGAGPCWPPPVLAPVVDPYREPACPWCPGNRGIAFGTPPGEAVHALAAGRVTFAGTVAGTVYVVVELANGWRVTYGNLAEPTVAVGDPVVAGLLLGRTAGAFHLGLRDRAERDGPPGDAYLDPTPYVGVWRSRTRLIPPDGGPARAAPPTLHCPGAA